MDMQNDRINQAIRITWFGFYANIVLALFKLAAGGSFSANVFFVSSVYLANTRPTFSIEPAAIIPARPALDIKATFGAFGSG